MENRERIVIVGFRKDLNVSEDQIEFFQALACFFVDCQYEY